MSPPPPISRKEVTKIWKLCHTSVSFNYIDSLRPKDRNRYIRTKTAKLVNRFAKEGGRKDYVITDCFRKFLESIVPGDSKMSLGHIQKGIKVTSKDWLEIARILGQNPSQKTLEVYHPNKTYLIGKKLIESFKNEFKYFLY